MNKLLLLLLLIAAPVILAQDFGSGTPLSIDLGPPVAAGPSGFISLVMSNIGTINTVAATEYTPYGAGDAANGPQATESDVYSITATSGTIDELSVRLDGDIGTSADDLTVTLMLDGVAQSLACTVEGEDVGDQETCTDSVNSVVVAQG